MLFLPFGPNSFFQPNLISSRPVLLKNACFLGKDDKTGKLGFIGFFWVFVVVSTFVSVVVLTEQVNLVQF